MNKRRIEDDEGDQTVPERRWKECSWKKGMEFDDDDDDSNDDDDLKDEGGGGRGGAVCIQLLAAGVRCVYHLLQHRSA